MTRASGVDESSIDLLMQYGIDVPNRTLFCTAYGIPYDGENEGEGGVNWEMADRLIKGLWVLDKSPGNINIIINNFGGDEDHCRAVMGAIRNCENHVTGTVYGRAESAAAWILQACDWRVMDRYSNLMLHMGSGSRTRHNRHMDDLFSNILLEKIRQKVPEYTKAKLVNRLHEDWYLYPTQAIEMGLADAVGKLIYKV